MELEGDSNSGTSVAFLTQLKEKHPVPLRVIWDNAPARRGEAVREYLRTPELELRLVNPHFHEGRLCRATARTSTPMRLSGGLGARGGHWQSVPGEQGGGAGEVGKFLAGLSSRKDEVRQRCRTGLQSRAETLPPRFPAPGKCTSHLGFGLVLSQTCFRW